MSYKTWFLENRIPCLHSSCSGDPSTTSTMPGLCSTMAVLLSTSRTAGWDTARSMEVLTSHWISPASSGVTLSILQLYSDNIAKQTVKFPFLYTLTWMSVALLLFCPDLLSLFDYSEAKLFSQFGSLKHQQMPHT